MQSGTQQSLRAPTSEIVETIGGITFADPYRPLEEESAESVAWQESQDDIAGEYLREWGGFEALRQRLVALTAHHPAVAPMHHGSFWFRLTPDPAGGRARLTVSHTPEGEGRALVDPNAMDADPPYTIDWFWPSPEGRYVAFGLSQGGDEQSTLHVVETESGELLPERIPFTYQSVVTWLPDASGFYFRAHTGPSQEHPHELLYFHELRDTAPPRLEDIEYSEILCFPQIAADGRYVAAIMGQLEPRPYFVKRLPDGEWRPFLRGHQGMCYGVFVGDSYVAVDRGGFTRGRLVSIPVETVDDPSTWRELIAESDVVLHAVSRVGNRLVLSELVDARARLTVTDLEGSRLAEVPLPEPGMAAPTAATSLHVWSPMVIPSTGAGPETGEPVEIVFVFQSLASSPATYRYDLDSGALNTIQEASVRLQGLTVRQEFCTSADGTRVPYFLLHRDDLDLSRPHPVLIHAYGGFNYALLPGFYPHFAEFARAGGTFALVSARGGAEYGTDWWQGGRMLQKQRTFDDVYAAAEKLVADGLTERGRIGFVGASNGGLLAGAAVTQRPDLFGVVVPIVPVLDLMRVWRDSFLGEVCAIEYGDPRIPEQAAALYAYSPYHNVRQDTTYPATLVVAGEADVRCPLWHSRKLVARLQDATIGDAPIMLRIWRQTGHGTGVSRDEATANTAEWMGFIMRQLGLAPEAVA